jgi:hypothetical protein
VHYRPKKGAGGANLRPFLISGNTPQPVAPCSTPGWANLPDASKSKSQTPHQVRGDAWGLRQVFGRPNRAPNFLIADLKLSCEIVSVEPLSPAYVSALAAQLAALSAFLGGFAATFLATLLTLGHQSRLMTTTIGLAVTSAVSFIVTVVAATMLNAIYHPDAPSFIAGQSASQPQTIMTLGFAIGSFSLLASLGCSGWSRSRGIGLITTTAALIGSILVVSLIVQVG